MDGERGSVASAVSGLAMTHPASLRRAADCLQPGTLLTPGYCWQTYFKVPGVLFLREVSSAFLPSKKTCWAHKFWHLEVCQQYPPVYLANSSVASKARALC